MKATICVIATLFLAGCATVQRIDRASQTDFMMIGPDAWRMTAKTNLTYPEDSERAEAVRMQWLEVHTRAQGCADFEVTSRNWTHMAGGVPAKVGTLLYEGTCERSRRD